jgi:hypothetical protein
VLQAGLAVWVWADEAATAALFRSRRVVEPALSAARPSRGRGSTVAALFRVSELGRCASLTGLSPPAELRALNGSGTPFRVAPARLRGSARGLAASACGVEGDDHGHGLTREGVVMGRAAGGRAERDSSVERHPPGAPGPSAAACRRAEGEVDGGRSRS